MKSVDLDEITFLQDLYHMQTWYLYNEIYHHLCYVPYFECHDETLRLKHQSLKKFTRITCPFPNLTVAPVKFGNG